MNRLTAGTRSPRQWVWWLTFAAVAAVFLTLNRGIVTGSCVPMWDADSFSAPTFTLVSDYARSGRLLLWNPWTNGGSPDFALYGAFSPVTVLAGWIAGPTVGGFMAYWLAMWLWGGVGVLFLARHLRVPPWAAFVVVLGYLFSGFFTGHAQHTSLLHTYAWAPFVIWRLDKGLLERRWRPAVEAGALLGLSALGGYPGIVMMAGGFAVLWALGRLFFGWPELDEPPRSGVTLIFAIAAVAVMFAVCAVIAAPVYGGYMVESRGFSDRAGPLTRERAIGENALPLGALATFASPYLSMLNMYTHRELWPYVDVSSCSVYAGVLALPMALFALLSRPKDRWRWWLAAVALLSIGLACGRALPLRGWLYDLVPPTRYFRHASTFRGFAILPEVILALYGMRDLSDMLAGRTAMARVRLIAATILPCAAAIYAYHTVISSVAEAGALRGYADTHLYGAWGGVCVAGLLCVWARSRIVKAAVVCLLPAIAVADASCVMLLSSGTVCRDDWRAVRGWEIVDSFHNGSLDLTERGLDRQVSLDTVAGFKIREGAANKNIPLKVPILSGYSPLINNLHRLWVTNKPLAALATGRDRVWFSPASAQVPPTAASFEVFRQRVVSDGVMPIVIHDPEKLTAIGQTPGGGPLDDAAARTINTLPGAARIGVRVREYTGDTLWFSVDCPSDGWLLVTDRWAPGWRATVNGQPATVWGGAFIFRAVEVRKGNDDIRFEYHPFGYPWLLAASWVTLGCVGTISLWRGLRRRPGACRTSIHEKLAGPEDARK